MQLENYGDFEKHNFVTLRYYITLRAVTEDMANLKTNDTGLMNIQRVDYSGVSFEVNQGAFQD